VLARLLRERRRFVVVTTVAVGLSLIPAIAAPDDTATKAVLVGCHLLAAAIIIPTLSRQLTAVNKDRQRGGTSGETPSVQAASASAVVAILSAPVVVSCSTMRTKLGCSSPETRNVQR
jgi:hypothetical protein